MRRQLVGVEVVGLMDRFNHKVDFPPDWEFVILHGPNGVGKTRLLELIACTYEPNLARLFRMAFKSAEFRFDDATTLRIVRSEQQELPEMEGPDPQPHTLRFIASRGDEVSEWEVAVPRLTKGSISRVAQVELGLERIGPELWRDEYGEVFDSEALMDRYPHLGELMADRRRLHSTRSLMSDAPAALAEIFEDAEAHLIETQRLLRPMKPRHLRESEPVSATVEQYARDLAHAISSALARNSRESQQRDRTFPSRILQQSALPAEATEEAIRRRYENLVEYRKRLAQVGLLDTSYDIPLPNQDLEDYEIRVLWTYLDDTEAKLSTFDDLQKRIQLFQEIVERRFLFKSMQIDRERGFIFVTDRGVEVRANQLSSGEQHEVVLMYDLLFNVSPGSLVLIDEPEISLHVAWQQEFLGDIGQISRLRNLRFVVATHSPQIVHKSWDRMVSLPTSDYQPQ